MEIRRLTVDDYDELLKMLNYTFGHKYGRPMDFVAEQPKMWVRDEEHMRKHFGVFEDGKLCSVVGMYPLRANIMGEEILFATTGNVATLPEYEGRGYFSKLFPLVMDACDEEGVDVARLGGSRQRYARYGFEGCGMLYRFTVTEHNVKHYFKNADEGVELTEIQAGDTDALMICHELISSRPFYIERSPMYNLRDVYLAMCSKESVPYLATRNGEAIGYVCVSHETHINELCAYTAKDFSAIAVALQRRVKKNISVPVAPYQLEEMREMGDGADTVNIEIPSRFRIRSFERLTSALMKLKASYENLPDFELTLEIADYGAITLYCRDGVAGCERTNRSGDLLLDSHAAARLLFGPLPVSAVADVPLAARAWLPLPMTWATLDYV